MRKKLFVICVVAIAVVLLLNACAGVDLTLTFEVDGEVYATVNTMGQETVKMPKDPEKEGYIFDGWYWDKDVWEKPFTANSLLETPLSENMIVYAKWKLKAETHEHAYGEWEVVTPATCTAEGLQKHACTVCGEEETEAIPKLEHNYGEWTAKTPATCTTEGAEQRVCKVCQEVETRTIAKLLHTFGDWLETIPATCTSEGLETRECSVCGVKETRSVESLAHMYEQKKDENHHWQECSVCYNIIEVSAHEYGVWQSDGTNLYKECAICVNRQMGESDKLTYTSANADDYQVSGVKDKNNLGDVIVPSNYLGREVIGIGNYAFRECSSLTSIVIPDSVTSIGFGAFYECSNLKSITIPFVGATKDGTSYTHFGYIFGASRYSDNETLVPSSFKEVIITGGTSIGEEAFYNCSSLTSIAIGNSVTSIGNSAFWGCRSLTSITIPESVTSIGFQVFAFCSRLTSIAIPESVMSIGNAAFTYCSSLASITIPNNVTIIGRNAFNGCIGLTSIAIPDSVTSIGNYAFKGCSRLTSIVIPDSVTSIGNYAFNGCSGLTSVVIPDSVTSIGNYAFYNCNGLTSVVIPDSVTIIGENAFSGCNGLTIYTEAAAKPSGWESLDCPVVCDYKNNDVANDGYIYTVQNGIRYGIKDGAAVVKRQLSNITEAYIASEIIYKDTRYSVTSIGDYAFNECGSLTRIAIPNSVTIIGTYAFYGCSSLTSIVIGNSVTSIGDYAFRGCGSLTRIVIPNGVTSIGDYAFNECGSLTRIVIPNGVTSIGVGAFGGCISLETIMVAEGNTKYHSAGNCLIETETKTLIAVCKASVIPTDGSVTSIGTSAFYECNSLTSIAIPDSVTSIGSYAFNGCSSLTSIEIPNSVTSIGSYAFDDCSSLTIYAEAEAKPSGWEDDWKGYCPVVWDYKNNDVADDGYIYTIQNGIRYGIKDRSAKVAGQRGNITEGYIVSGITYKSKWYSVTSIGGSAFYGCSSLTSIEIPDSVTSIGESAFYDCSSLTSIEYGGTKADWNAIWKGRNWNSNTGEYTVRCTDGTLTKSES